MFNDAVSVSRHERIFGILSEQYENKTLKEIAVHVGIKKNLHWHIGRHTFISLYYSKSRDLLATKEFQICSK